MNGGNLSPRPLVSKNGNQALTAIALTVLAIYVIKTALNILIQKQIISFSYNLQAYLRNRFSALYLAAPYLFHTRRRSTEIINILQSHISQFSKATVGSLLQITAETITLIAVLGFLLVSYPLPSLIAFVMLAAFALIYDRLLRTKLRKAGEEIIFTGKGLIKSVNHGIKSLKEARVLGRGGSFYDEIEVVSNKAAKVNTYVTVMQMVPRFILELIIIAIVILSALAMILTGNSGDEVMNSLAVFAVAAIRLLPSANRIINNISNLRYSSKAVEELWDDREHLIGYDVNPQTLQIPSGEKQSFKKRKASQTSPSPTQKRKHLFSKMYLSRSKKGKSSDFADHRVAEKAH